MNREDYPQELTEDEADLGFRLLEIQSLGKLGSENSPAVAVARILSPSSILVKTFSGYDHLIFGHCAITTEREIPMWNCGTEMRIPETKDAAQFLHKYEVGLIAPARFPIEECNFSYKEV
jgi:hypothetical protein